MRYDIEVLKSDDQSLKSVGTDDQAVVVTGLTNGSVYSLRAGL
ncbi:hypothetical protein ABZU32_32640 [Sphaerisporangium sp. NPDC005288]